jgi:cytohesin
LHIAASQGHKGIVKLLLANDADVNAGARYNRTAAEFAMNGGHTQIVELLISKGADISPLHFAIYMKDEVKARSLIEGGADVNKPTPYGTTPLDRAVFSGSRNIAELLIDKGADVNGKDNWNWTVLHSAVYSSEDVVIRTGVVRLLIARGANVNACDCGGRTPLSYAKNEGYTNVVELLKKHGAKQ